MRKRLPIFMGEVPKYEIRDDHMHIIWRELEIVQPVSTVLAGMGRAKRVIDNWQRKTASVIKFPGEH